MWKKNFIKSRGNTHSYALDTRARIAAGEAKDMPLDQVTLEEYTRANVFFLEVCECFAKKLQVEYLPTDTNRYLERLDFLGFDTLGAFEDTLHNNRELIFDLVKKTIEKHELDMVTTGMVIRALCEAELVDKQYTREQIVRFMRLRTEDESVIERRTEEILKRIQKV